MMRLARAVRRSPALAALLVMALGPGTACLPTGRTASPTAGRAVVTDGESSNAARHVFDRWVSPPLRFTPPEAERLTLRNGVTVFFLEDRTLPLVTVFADFRGGFPHFPREDYAAAMAVPSLVLTGGTVTTPPDSLDKLIEFYAISASVGSGGERSYASMNTLTRHLDPAFDLWTEMLRSPRFDPARLEAWRLRELDSVRRMRDLPNTVAISAFNQVMFGDHYVGWIMEESDLAPERLSPERLRRVHGEIFCAGNLVLGLTGDLDRAEAERRLEATFGGWPACPRALERPAPPRLRSEGGIVLVHRDLTQSSIVMGMAGGVVQRDSADFYASQIANLILGGGGFSSRILSRVRSEAGLSYDAWSTWTAGTRGQGIFGAFAQTRGETTVAAATLLREIIEEMREGPPTDEEVSVAVENLANGFVFAFEEPASIVSRQMVYHGSGLPADWLERYIAGIQGVTPATVQEVVSRHIRPAEMTIVIVGDTTRFDLSAGTLGRVVRP